jgi:hypothetical protein
MKIQFLKARSIYWHGLSPVCELNLAHRALFTGRSQLEFAQDGTLPWWLVSETKCTALVKQGCVALVKWKGNPA